MRQLGGLADPSLFKSSLRAALQGRLLIHGRGLRWSRPHFSADFLVHKP